MTENEREALAWLGAQAQRTQAIARAPFIVTGFLLVLPTFFIVHRELLEYLPEKGALGFSAFIALVPAVAGIASAAIASPWILARRRSRLLREAASRFGLQEEWLERATVV